MGTIISKIYDEIQLHGNYEAYCAHRDREDTSTDQEDDIPYFPNPEVVRNAGNKFPTDLDRDFRVHFPPGEVILNHNDEKTAKRLIEELKNYKSESHSAIALDYSLLAGGVKKVCYLRANNEHDDQKGDTNTSVGIT